MDFAAQSRVRLPGEYRALDVPSVTVRFEPPIEEPCWVEPATQPPRPVRRKWRKPWKALTPRQRFRAKIRAHNRRILAKSKG